MSETKTIDLARNDAAVVFRTADDGSVWVELLKPNRVTRDIPVAHQWAGEVYRTEYEATQPDHLPPSPMGGGA